MKRAAEEDCDLRGEPPDLTEEQVLAYRYMGTRFDCGSKLGYLKATVEFALRHPEVKDEFEAYLQTHLPAALAAAA